MFIDGQSVTGREDDRALDDVLELPHIAGPPVGHQLAHTRRVNAAIMSAGALPVALREVLHQQRDVLPPIAQWRHLDGKYVC